MPGPQPNRKRPAKHCRGGIYAARTRLLCLIREHHIQPHGPYKDAYHGKREIAEIVQNRAVDFLTACAEQDAKENQCNAF